MQNDIPDRFYNMASDTMRAAQLGQLDYTPDQLRIELENIAAKQVRNWSAFVSPYIPNPPDVLQITLMIDDFVAKYEAWLGDGKPALPPWPKESSI